MTKLTDEEKIDLLATKICGSTYRWNPLAKTRQGLMDALDVVDSMVAQGFEYSHTIDVATKRKYWTFYGPRQSRYPGEGTTIQAAIVDAALKFALGRNSNE